MMLEANSYASVPYPTHTNKSSENGRPAKLRKAVERLSMDKVDFSIQATNRGFRDSGERESQLSGRDEAFCA